MRPRTRGRPKTGLDIETQPKWRTVASRRSDSDDGVILVEFALVSVVFFALLFGGLFVLMSVIAKGETVSGVAAGAQLAAVDDLTAPELPNCVAHPPRDTAGNPATGDTLTVLCEIEQTIGTEVLGNDNSSLQVAISCVDQSGPTDCADATAVWVCARTWDPNQYPLVVSPGWITSNDEQPVPTTSVPTTSVPAPSPLTFHSFMPENAYNATPALSCP
jgi:hypothetical protein